MPGGAKMGHAAKMGQKGFRSKRSAPWVCGLALMALLAALQINPVPAASAGPGTAVRGALSPVLDADGRAWVLSLTDQGLARVPVGDPGQGEEPIRLSAGLFDLADQAGDTIAAARAGEIYLWTSSHRDPVIWSLPGKPGLIRLTGDGVAVNLRLDSPDGYRESVLFYGKNGRLRWAARPIAGVITAIAPGTTPGRILAAYSPLGNGGLQHLLVIEEPGVEIRSLDLPGPLVQAVAQGPDGLILAAQGERIVVAGQSPGGIRSYRQTGWVSALAPDDEGLIHFGSGRYLGAIETDGTVRGRRKLPADIVDLRVDSRRNRAILLLKGGRIQVVELN